MRNQACPQKDRADCRRRTVPCSGASAHPHIVSCELEGRTAQPFAPHLEPKWLRSLLILNSVCLSSGYGFYLMLGCSYDSVNGKRQVSPVVIGILKGSVRHGAICKSTRTCSPRAMRKDPELFPAPSKGRSQLIFLVWCNYSGL